MKLTSPTILTLCLALPITAQSSGAPVSTWIDFDGDGLRDLYVRTAGAADQLLANRGDGALEDVTHLVGLGGQRGSVAAAWSEPNERGRRSLLLVRPDGTLRLFEPAANGAFEDRTAHRGLEGVQGVMSIEWIDDVAAGAEAIRIETETGQRVLGAPAARSLEGPIRSAPATSARTERSVPSAHASSSAANGPSSGRGSLSRSSSTRTPGALGRPGGVASHIEDRSGGQLSASSLPTLGMLHPIGEVWNVTPTGVGIGVDIPQADLDVASPVRLRAGGIKFPDGTVQSTATLAGPQGSPGPQGPAGQDGKDGQNGSDGVDGIDSVDAAGDLFANRQGATSGVERRMVLAGNRSGNSPFAALRFLNYDNGGAQGEITAASIVAYDLLEVGAGGLAFSTRGAGGSAVRGVLDAEGQFCVGGQLGEELVDVFGELRSRSGGFEFPDGSVQTTAYDPDATHVYVVGAGDFTSKSTNSNARIETKEYGGSFCTSTASLVAPLHLPDNAYVTRMTIHGFDRVQSTELEVTLGRGNFTNNSFDVLARHESDGAPWEYSVALTSIGAPVIRNDSYTYFILARVNGGTWHSAGHLAVDAVVIEYRLEQ